MIEKLRELLYSINVTYISIPRKSLFLMQLLQICFFGMILFLWRGIFIIFSLFLSVIAAVLTVISLRIWKRYYSSLAFILLLLVEVMTAIVLYITFVNI